MDRPVSAEMRSVEAASSIQKTPVLSASASEKSGDATDGLSEPEAVPAEGVIRSTSSTSSGGVRTRRESSRPETSTNAAEYMSVARQPIVATPSPSGYRKIAPPAAMPVSNMVMAMALRRTNQPLAAAMSVGPNPKWEGTETSST